MTPSASVVVAEIRDPSRHLTAALASAPTSFFKSVAALLRHLVHRFRAKLVFHDSRSYRQLVGRAFEAAGLPPVSELTVAEIRRLDPNGLGVWLLAQSPGSPRLQDLCARAIATPGLGPPRVIARAIERALDGQTVCWFGESGGFDALTAEALISAALSGTLVAWELAKTGGAPPLHQAITQLTTTANATQAAVRAHQRVLGSAVRPAQDAVRCIYQALNLLRRAVNRTDLRCVEEQMAREAARQAVSAAAAASAAALLLSQPGGETRSLPLVTASREKLAATARSVDALTARVSSLLRHGSAPASSENLLLDQSARILSDAAKALRPWSIQLSTDADSPATTRLDLCAQANELALSSAEMLEAWAVLHELLQAQLVPPQHGLTPPRRSNPPEWATRLVRTVTKRWTYHDVFDSIRRLSGPPTGAVSAAVMLAVLRNSNLQFQRQLWKLIQSAHSNQTERSLAFQLFWILAQRPPE